MDNMVKLFNYILPGEDYGCPVRGWQQFRQSCYLLVQKKLSWSEALKYCHTEDSYLATIDNNSEQNYIWSQLPQGRAISLDLFICVGKKCSCFPIRRFMNINFVGFVANH